MYFNGVSIDLLKIARAFEISLGYLNFDNKSLRCQGKEKKKKIHLNYLKNFTIFNMHIKFSIFCKYKI